MTDPLLSNYQALAEHSMNSVDLDGLEDGTYYPNMAGFDYYYHTLDKDQEGGGKCCLDTDMFYPIELKSSVQR